ncbi:MAG: DUF952 domain-containing protein [Myxococcales bacterium]|nr:DUF952 domain-containing protein [Myxococcales bacterium]
MRWLYHILPVADLPAARYAPASLAREGFLHASYRDSVAESARLYFPPLAPLAVLQIDPRRLDVPVAIASTPRGPMPHLHGAIPRDAIRAILTVDAVAGAPDRVTGTRFAFVAFDGMTLLDLVGVHDPIARIASMGFDASTRCEIVGATGAQVWSQSGALLTASRVRPPLDEFDVVIIPGGHGTRVLERSAPVLEWLAAFPHNRLIASVCTGALLLGAAGRLRGLSATTHASVLDRLPGYGATPVCERVVDQGQVVTAGGVTCALDLGLHLVRRIEGEATALAIARQMELPSPVATGT